MRNKDKVFPANTTEVTKAMVLKYEDEFLIMFGTLHCKLSDNNTAAYVAVLQQCDTILYYHQDISHT